MPSRKPGPARKARKKVARPGARALAKAPAPSAAAAVAAPPIAPEAEEELRRGEERVKSLELREAGERFRRALALSPEDPRVLAGAAEAWRKSGWAALFGHDDPENGWFMLDRARSLFRRLGEGFRSAAAQAERGMAIAESKMGRLRESLLCLDRAEALAPDPEEMAKIWNTRAVTRSYLGEDEAAKACAEKALEICGRSGDAISAAGRRDVTRNALQTLGICHLKRGDVRKALEFLHDEVIRAWARLEDGHPEDVLALQPARRPRIHVLKARAHLAAGRDGEAEAELLEAEALFEKARARIDSEMDRAVFSGTGMARHVNDRLVSMAAAGGRWGEAFLRSERGRARSFLEFVADARARPGGPARPSERRRLDDLREQLETQERQAPRGACREERLEQLRHEHAMSVRRFEKERLAENRVQPREAMGEGEVRERLGEGEALAAFHETGDAIHAFLLERGSFRHATIAGAELLEDARDLAEVVALSRRGERQGTGGFFDWHFGRMGAALLGEVPLEGVRRLAVAPHGALNLVPFPALRVGGAHLVERVAVTLAPGAGVHVTLAEKARGAPPPRSCLWVRDPTRTLSQVEGEERALRERFGRGLTVLAGDEAVPEAVLEAAPRHDALHFTTHAVFRPERPELSYLEMAGRRRLLACDLMWLDLSRARIVTISACESGRGDFAHANEMVGLSRAFLRAGACSVLATLWPVEDHPAIGDLMRGFYGALGPNDPAEALQAAQVQCIRKGAPATVWAAFALFGS